MIYGERRKILEGEDLTEEALGFVRDVVEATVSTYCPPEVFAEEWDRDGLLTALSEIYPVSLTKEQVGEIGDSEALQAAFVEDALAAYAAKEESLGEQTMRELERVVLLNIIDTRWREHLYEMDYLQEGIYLRSYAQKDPITEYRREAFDMFEELTVHDPDGVRPLHLPGRACSTGAAATAGVRTQGEPRPREPRRRGAAAGSGAVQDRTRTRSSATRSLGTPRARAAAAGSTRSATAPWLANANDEGAGASRRPLRAP